MSYEYIVNMMEKDTSEFLNDQNISLLKNNENILKNEFKQSKLNSYIELLKKNFKYVKLYFDSSLRIGLNSFLYSYTIINKSIILDKNIDTFYSSNFTFLQENNISEEINKFFSGYWKIIVTEIDQETWKENSCPIVYQKFVNFIESCEINHLKNLNYDEALLILNKIDENKDNQLIEFLSTSDGNTYKIIKSSVVLIKFLFDNLKLVMWLDSYLFEGIAQQVIP